MRMKEFFEKIKHFYQVAFQFVTHDIWVGDFSSLSKTKARLVKDLKIILVTFRGFSKQRLGREAVALSYFSTMAVVPMVAIILFVSNGFGFDQFLSDMLFKSFPTSTQLINVILRSANNILVSLDKGIFGWISFFTFLWMVIWLMLNIETVFNRIWHVQKSRNFFKRIAVYITIMVLAPFLLIIFLYGWTYYGQFINVVKVQFGGIFSFLTGNLFWLSLYGLTVLILSLIYKFIPHAKVKYASALKASSFSALIFVLIQYLYIETQLMVTRLSAVYGVLAAIPLFMVWMNYCWNVILIGSELSFGFQHVDDFDFTKNTLKG